MFMLHLFYLPICAECAFLIMFFDLTASLIRSTSCWYRLRSREAFSFASFNADSKALTLSAVALSRFSSFGSSQRRSALSRTNWTYNNVREFVQQILQIIVDF